MDVGECSYEQSYDGRRSDLPERVEVRTRPERRRRSSAAAKLVIVRETLAMGAVAQVVADRHGIGTGLIYTWRKQLLRTAVAGFAAVEIRPDAPATLPGPAGETEAPVPVPMVVEAAPATPSSGPGAGGIEVELPSGVRLRVGPDVDGAALQRVLAALASP